MKSNEIVFQLNSTERIIIELQESLNAVHCCYGAPINFIQNNNKYLLNNDSVRESMYSLRYLLETSLKNELQLPDSLKPKNLEVRDIGYFFNEYRQSKPATVYEIDEAGKKGDWIGSKYLLWGKDGATWMYNNENGEIVFEITPCFPGKPTYWFQEEPFTQEEIENSMKYEEWVKNYKPILTRVIPKETAKKWLNQANNILETIEKNIVRMKAEGKF